MKMDVLAALLVLGLCGSLALGNDVKSSAPEDLDGSGDDGDYSGSGNDIEEIFKEDLTTPVSPLASTITQTTIDQNTDIIPVHAGKDAAQLHTTKPEEAIEVADHTTQAGTTLESTTQHTTAAELIDLDVNKHHKHHTHPHHTTTHSTTVSDLDDGNKVFAGVDEQEPTEESTTSTPDEIEEPFQRLTTPFDIVQPGGHHQETTSGSTSTPFADNEESNKDTDDFPVLVHAETTVAGSPTPEHGSHHEQTTGVELNVYEEADPEPTEEIEPDEDLLLQGVPSTTPSEENKHHHGHHHHHPHPHHHNHTTAPSATEPTDSEKHHIAHTQLPKGRNANVPLASSTTATPILNEDKPIEPIEKSTSSTMQHTTSIKVLDEADDSLDSKEDIGSSGFGSVDEADFFLEATVPVIKHDNKANQSPEGSSDASHGIMERKELLAGIITGGVAGLVFAAALVAFVLYRMKKKDEGSYSLEEPKQSNGGYQKPREQREFYA